MRAPDARVADHGVRVESPVVLGGAGMALLVVAMMAQLSNKPVKTFTVVRFARLKRLKTSAVISVAVSARISPVSGSATSSASR